MAGFASQAALFKVAKQTAKGTAATAGFWSAIAEQSGLNPRRDEINQTPEHGMGYDRATEHKSATQFGSYLVTGNLQTGGYTETLGYLLLGAGFTVTTTGAGAAKTHVFKLASRDNYSWLSIISKIGSAAKKAVDCRVNRLGLEAGVDVLRYTAGFLGLTYSDATGSETGTDEARTKLSPAIGSLILTLGGVQIVNTTADQVQRVTMDINNALSEDERSLFRFKRADLPQTGLDITGAVEGLELDYTDTYNQLMRSGATSGEPSTAVAVGSLVYHLDSAIDIPTTSTPYSLDVNLASIEATLDDFQAEGNNIVRWNTRYRMIDDVADPVIITLVNGKASY